MVEKEKTIVKFFVTPEELERSNFVPIYIYIYTL